MRSTKNRKEMSKNLAEFVASIRQEAIAMDKEAVENGKIIKYIFEVKKEEKTDLAFLYSDIYLSKSEALNRVNIKLNKKDELIIRGPFPLFEGSLSDAKIARWEKEKAKSERDLSMIEDEKEIAKISGFKYIYVLYSTEYKVDRVVDFQVAEKAMTTREIRRLLKKLPATGRLERVNLINESVKIYEDSFPS
jgi:hypothetical protein